MTMSIYSSIFTIGFLTSERPIWAVCTRTATHTYTRKKTHTSRPGRPKARKERLGAGLQIRRCRPRLPCFWLRLANIFFTLNASSFPSQISQKLHKKTKNKKHVFFRNKKHIFFVLRFRPLSFLIHPDLFDSVLFFIEIDKVVSSDCRSKRINHSMTDVFCARLRNLVQLHGQDPIQRACNVENHPHEVLVARFDGIGKVYAADLVAFFRLPAEERKRKRDADKLSESIMAGRSASLADEAVSPIRDDLKRFMQHQLRNKAKLLQCVNSYYVINNSY